MAIKELDQLRGFLESQPAGLLTDGVSSEVINMLMDIWGLLPNSDAHKTSADKLSRAEEFRWKPPILSFSLERHGGTVQGSTRAEIHRWTLNLESGDLNCDSSRFRQVIPRDRPLKVGPIAQEVAQAILTRDASDKRLRWKNDHLVYLNMGEIIPNDRLERTITGRRKRFRKALNDILKPTRWKEESTNKYEEKE